MCICIYIYIYIYMCVYTWQERTQIRVCMYYKCKIWCVDVCAHPYLRVPMCIHACASARTRQATSTQASTQVCM